MGKLNMQTFIKMRNIKNIGVYRPIIRIGECIEPNTILPPTVHYTVP
jgi:hypothetical protein